MSQTLIIPLIALLASSGVEDGVKKRTIQGGEMAEYALELCLSDSRDIDKGFYIEAQDLSQGTYILACQTLETTTGKFYAVKGKYVTGPTLNTLIKLFEEHGINVSNTGINN